MKLAGRPDLGHAYPLKKLHIDIANLRITE